MLITAMPTQISEMRTTWAVFTDLVLVIREARNDPRSSTAFGAAPLVGQDCSITAVAPMPSPTAPLAAVRRSGSQMERDSEPQRHDRREV